MLGIAFTAFDSLYAALTDFSKLFVRDKISPASFVSKSLLIAWFAVDGSRDTTPDVDPELIVIFDPIEERLFDEVIPITGAANPLTLAPP
ncbi:hypothetical protein AA16373_3230 [Komagataeibacter swingsii DSM 16373]|nr:hypothetical protein AA16373_3230 [Komagataeibacter swingsii DSM 16373]